MVQVTFVYFANPWSKLQVSRQCERGQVGVIPDLRRKRLTLGEGSPMSFKIDGFLGKRDARIAQEKVILLPGFRQAQGVLAENVLVGCQPQESLLRQAAEEADG